MYAPATEDPQRITLAELDAQLADALPARELMGGDCCYCCCKSHLISVKLKLAIGLL